MSSFISSVQEIVIVSPLFISIKLWYFIFLKEKEGKQVGRKEKILQPVYWLS